MHRKSMVVTVHAGACRPRRTPTSFVDELLFRRPKAKNGTGDVEKGIICILRKTKRGQDMKQNRPRAFVLKKRNIKNKCIGCCPCAITVRNVNGPAKIHLSPSDENINIKIRLI